MAASRHLAKHVLQLHKLDFHIWKVEPSNSLTKRATSFRQIERRIRYVEVSSFPKKEVFLPIQSFSEMQS